MIRYIGIEKDTPDFPRVWGEGETHTEAKLQCEIALREKLLGKLKRGCREDFAQPERYIIKEDKN